MRIAFFSSLTNAQWGGSEVLWSNVSMHMAKEENVVAAFVKQWDTECPPVSKLRLSGVHVYYYYDKFRKKTILKRIMDKSQQAIAGEKLILGEMFKWQPDFIFISQGHSYDLGYFSEQQLQPLFETKIPFAIICQNNSDYNFVPEDEVRAKINRLYKKADKVFFVSKRNKEAAERVVCGFIKNAGIISNSTSLSDNKIDVSFPEDKETQFATVARLRCSHKGQNLLLHVLSQQKWLDRSWKLNLYGTGEDDEYLKNLTAFLKMEERVIFHGYTSGIQNIWSNNHLMLLASFGEGMPLALQEAMLCGRPAMVTDVGGNAELITEGVTGWLADGTTFSAIDNALERAWADRPRWEEMGEQARQKIIDTIDLTPELTLSNYCVSVVNKKEK